MASKDIKQTEDGNSPDNDSYCDTNKSNEIKTTDPEFDERTIFVGNVNVKTKKKKLIKFFSKYGMIETIRFRGIAAESMEISKKEAIAKKKFHPLRNSMIAYVRFTTLEAKEKALRANGEVFEDLHLRVDSSNPTVGSHDKFSVFIGNLPWETNDEELWQFFGKCGSIKNVRVVRSSKSGAGKGIAFVSFSRKEGLEAALKLNGNTFSSAKERPLRILKAVKKMKNSTKRVTKRSGTHSLLHKNKSRMSAKFLQKDKPNFKTKRIGNDKFNRFTNKTRISENIENNLNCKASKSDIKNKLHRFKNKTGENSRDKKFNFGNKKSSNNLNNLEKNNSKNKEQKNLKSKENSKLSSKGNKYNSKNSSSFKNFDPDLKSKKKKTKKSKSDLKKIAISKKLLK